MSLKNTFILNFQVCESKKKIGKKRKEKERKK